MRRTTVAARTTLAALAASAAVASAPTSAVAASTAVIRDCQDGKIDGRYSQKEFSEALRNIPTDVDEYTDCRDVIRRAQLGAAGGSSSKADGASAAGGSSGGAAPPPPSSATANAGKTAAQILQGASPAERAAVTQATGRAGGPVEVGGKLVSPNAAGLSPAGAANVVPTPLIVALVLLGLGLALGATQTIRSHVLTRRTPAT